MVLLHLNSAEVVCIVTVVTVSDAVLKHSVPLLLFFLCHHTEVVVAGVRVIQDERELGHTLDERITAHFGLDTCRKSHKAARMRNYETQKMLYS